MAPYDDRSLDAGVRDAGAHDDEGDDSRGIGERVLEVVVAVLLTALVAVAGTVAHRMEYEGLPLGIVLGIALALTGAVLVRSVSGASALVLYGALGIAVVLLMTYWGPGDDVLVTSTPRAMLWILTMPLAAAIGWAAPTKWFSSRPVRLGRRADDDGAVRTDVAHVGADRPITGSTGAEPVAPAALTPLASAEVDPIRHGGEVDPIRHGGDAAAGPATDAGSGAGTYPDAGPDATPPTDDRR